MLNRTAELDFLMFGIHFRNFEKRRDCHLWAKKEKEKDMKKRKLSSFQSICLLKAWTRLLASGWRQYVDWPAAANDLRIHEDP